MPLGGLTCNPAKSWTFRLDDARCMKEWVVSNYREMKYSIDLLVWTRFPNSFHRNSLTLDLQVDGNHFYMRYNTPTNVIMISYDCTAGEIWEVEQKGHLKNQLRHEKKWALLSIDLDTLNDQVFFFIAQLSSKRQKPSVNKLHARFAPVTPFDARCCPRPLT